MSGVGGGLCTTLKQNQKQKLVLMEKDTNGGGRLIVPVTSSVRLPSNHRADKSELGHMVPPQHLCSYDIIVPSFSFSRRFLFAYFSRVIQGSAHFHQNVSSSTSEPPEIKSFTFLTELV